MDRKSVAQVVDLVSRAKQNKVPDVEISKQLIALGVPEGETSNLIESAVAGFQAGVNTIVTGGLSAEDYIPGENPVFDVAFHRGKAAMRFTTPFWVLMKFLAPFLIGAFVLGAILWKVFR